MERLDGLRNLIQEREFLEGAGLGNEVNIRIFCYDPEDEMAVRFFIEKLMADNNLSCNLIVHNLYKVFLSICNDMKITERVAQLEEDRGQQFVLGHMKRIATNMKFVEKMKYDPHQEGDVILIAGVGEAFPFIRVHSLLEAMQPYFSDVPVLVMYPGTFDGHYVKLFNKLRPNSYYRAFNIV